MKMKMKMKIKVSELINILIQKDEGPLVRKYNLDKDKLVKMQNSLRSGNWKFTR
ncbi:MAG: hypothetical protein V3V92_06375 [Candidatus Hydrothermarchaeales archaeon]